MSLIQGVENFDLKLLKQTNTEEKVILPSAEGVFFLLFYVVTCVCFEIIAIIV